MTRIDFYLLSGTAQREREFFACRLVEKALRNRHHVYVHTNGHEQARTLDELLWTFRPGSFIAHELVDRSAGAPSDSAVVVGFDYEPAGEQPVLVNLHSEVPVFFSRFERVLEVLNDDESVKRDGRTRYSYYRDRGYALAHHKVTA